MNEKELAEYPNWLKEQEQAKELREAEEKLENQAEQQEYELAKRVYSFVKPSDLYNYPDDTAALNTDEENIEIVKSDISDTRNVNDYVNALNKIRENIADTDSQKHELDVIISILEKRVPHYEYHLGDTVYIGADKYEIAGIKDNVVTLIDTKFPILNKQMSFDEFERKVKDNYSNDHLIVKEQKENSAEVDNDKGQTLEQDLYDFYNTYDIYDLNEVPIEQIRDDLKNSESIQQTIQYLKEILKQENEVNDFTNDLKEIIKKLEVEYERKVEKQETQKEEIVQQETEEQQGENKQQVEQEKPYKVGQKVYLESDRAYNIYSIDLEKDKIELQDLQMPIPIFREESILTFESLYNQNERNFPKQDIKPNFVRTKNKIQDFVLHPEIALENRNNYKITDNDLGIGTPREKFERNIAAIKVLKKCEEENRYATPEEQEIMSKYVGWGGLQQAFKEDDSSWSNEYKILKELLNDEEYKNARSSVLTAFYTPPIVINSMYEILQNMGLKEANILEPSCGVGNFFGMLPTQLKECKMYGVEIDSISGRIAQQLYQKSTIAVNAYEKVELPDSFFDVAVRQCTI